MSTSPARHVSLLLRSLADFFFPRFCHVCENRLLPGEQVVCARCYPSLPFTRLKGAKGNVLERLFWTKKSVVRANSFLYYLTGTRLSRPIIHFKYHHTPHAALYWGRVMATDLIDTDFFDGIDLIVPVPLSRKREKKRGYNQSALLAKGISAVTGIPVDTKSLVRSIDNPTQTTLSPHERERNVSGIFTLVAPESCSGKHILLVDDVLTYGYTLTACIDALEQASNVKISILTLAASGKWRFKTPPPSPWEE